MIWRVINCCKTCENLVRVATTIGKLQHSEYLKPTFLDTFKWVIRPVFPETVTNALTYQIKHNTVFVVCNTDIMLRNFIQTSYCSYPYRKIISGVYYTGPQYA